MICQMSASHYNPFQTQRTVRRQETDPHKFAKSLPIQKVPEKAGTGFARTAEKTLAWDDNISAISATLKDLS